MSEAEALVLYEIQDGVAVITLNRPDKRNAISKEMKVLFDAALTDAESNKDVRVIVVAANGPAFSSGADLGGGHGPTGILARWEQYKENDKRQTALWRSEKLIICAVHGYVIGRGLELALWCDILIASEDAKLGQPEVRDGSFVASMIPWLLNPQAAKLFMIGGDFVDAQEAQRLGLVTRVVPKGEAKNEAMKMARRLSHVPAVTTKTIKHSINSMYEQMGLRAAQNSGSAYSALLAWMTAEEKGVEELERIRKEHGLKAFLEARDAPFKS